jgi:hypothetical protein
MKKSNLKLLNELLQNHDWNYQYSNDQRWWKKGSEEKEAIHKFIYLNGGWNKQVMDTWNKNAPKKYHYDMEWVKECFINNDSAYIIDMKRKYNNKQ